MTNGQQLYARIKKSSKYFGQGNPNELFKVFVEVGHKDAYLVKGGVGGQYRLADVYLYLIDGANQVRIS